MKNILMALALVGSLVLSACTGCKKEEVVKEETSSVVPAAPEATTAPTEQAATPAAEVPASEVK